MTVPVSLKSPCGKAFHVWRNGRARPRLSKRSGETSRCGQNLHGAESSSKSLSRAVSPRRKIAQKMLRNTQNNRPASAIDTGSVRIHASARLRTVRHCRPEPFAAIVPATPDDSTCVVLTGRP
ncbi:hypothetical protein AWB78_01410 [Caballeronia calidae]|uniref:Uncharacterized protein n=1 Tax=Caballeronia calidae TaxID=1777139 RepID=A0A158AA96_9BURK|nr:hypothetical protein AWB78_01410 [Caballeronia calidae]